MMEVRFIKKSEWGDLQSFNAAEYSQHHILTNKVYYDWQFDNVFNPKRATYTSLGIFGKDGKMIGNIGVFPAPCSFFGKSVGCNWLANMIVNKNLRSIGYGYLLLDRSAGTSDLVIDHNINKAALPLFRKSGWQDGDIKRYLCVLNRDRSEWVMGKKDLGVKIFQYPSRTPDANFKFEKIEKFDKGFDRFWDVLKDKYPITIERSSKYLNWRYADHPLIKYKIFAVRKSNELQSFLVLRIEGVTEGAQRKPTGIKLGRIIDFVATDEAEEYTLLKTVEFCQKQKLDFIDFFLTGDFYKSALARLSFVDADQHPYSLMPTLLNPIDRVKRTKHNFAFKLISQGLFDPRIQNFDYWYTTKGGGDQDRPN